MRRGALLAGMKLAGALFAVSLCFALFQTSPALQVTEAEAENRATAVTEIAKGDVEMFNRVVFHTSPLPIDRADYLGAGHDVLMQVAIVNPFGPTVYGLDVIERRGQPKRDLVSFSLNPFATDFLIHGTVEAGLARTDVVRAIIASNLELGVLDASRPTVVMPGTIVDDAFRQLFQWKVQRSPDVRQTLELLRRFPLNSYDRISAEVDAGLSQLTPETVKEPPAAARPATSVSAAEVAEFIAIIGSASHTKVELEAFAMAWVGSITFQADSGNRALAERAMTYEDLVNVIAMTGASTRTR